MTEPSRMEPLVVHSGGWQIPAGTGHYPGVEPFIPSWPPEPRGLSVHFTDPKEHTMTDTPTTGPEGGSGASDAAPVAFHKIPDATAPAAGKLIIPPGLAGFAPEGEELVIPLHDGAKPPLDLGLIEDGSTAVLADTVPMASAGLPLTPDRGEHERRLVARDYVRLQGFATRAGSHPPTDRQLALAEQIRSEFLELAAMLVNRLPDTESRGVALMELQAAKMWAVQAVFDA